MESIYNNPYKSIILNPNSDLIRFETRKEFYLNGEIIEGNIIFDNIKNIKVSDISICLYQKESWFIQETAEVKYGEKYNQLISKYDIKMNEFLNNNEILVPGKYIFPFKIQLPNDLEPSFEYPYPNRYSYLRYILQCEFLPNFPELKHQKAILIKSISHNILLQQVFSSIVNVHKWGFFDSGTTILKVSYEKSIYQINNIVPLNIDIDNNRGKLKVKSCKIRVIRTIEFSKLDGPEKYPLEKTIYSREYLAEVLPFDKRNFLFQILLIDNDLIDFKYIKEENPYPGINNINILLPTMNSKILKCDYRIQVSLYFDNFVTSGYRPRVKLPIIISHFIEEENCEIKRNDNISYNNNYNNNLIDSKCNINESSLIYDQNFMNLNNRNDTINNNNNIRFGSINETEKDKDLTEYIKSNEFEKQNISEKDKKNNKNPNYVELKKEFFYNINEI